MSTTSLPLLDWQALSAEYRENGIVKIPGLLNDEVLAECRKAWEWIRYENPGPSAMKFFGNIYNDYGGGKGAKKVFGDLVQAHPIFAKASQKLWGVGEDTNVWFLGPEIFEKRYAPGRSDSTFHQDTSAGPFYGDHMAGFWICFEDYIPAKNSLEVVKGSHKGPLYNLSKNFFILPPDPSEVLDDTSPLYEEAARDGTMPPIPDIQKEREKWDLLSYPLAKGDVTVFHWGVLHGNAPVDAELPRRTTLTLRFFGEECFWHPRPIPEAAVRAGIGDQYAPEPGLQAGDPFVRSGGGKWTRCAGPGLGGAAKL